ncbi:hypothetical protein [Sulfobacillus harzensis]|uniref:Uncharacterized protein n=1 Tax=Sulfobacillus harzensis TaxID=2729629 RepID=A0A7Y0L050_9FIRM|nr:hypothetical protein [Sulfobacillus harzensis]NMP20828.1 hypothetical protein [Sulfobacillus harzensis]
MAKLWIIVDNQLPPPETHYDLAIWPTHQEPTEAELRSWAGWAETPLLAGSVHTGVWGYTRDLKEWPSSDLSLGQGRVWRFDGRYLAWLDSIALRVPETARALALAGVDLLIAENPKTPPTPYQDPLWRSVQANQIFGLTVAPEPFWYLPCDSDPNEEGWSQPTRVSGGYAISYDFQDLAQARRLFPIHQGLRAPLYRQERWWGS